LFRCPTDGALYRLDGLTLAPTGDAEVPCPRCAGTDFIPRFAHVEKGRCFRCNGYLAIRVKLHRDGTVDHDHLLPIQYWKAPAEQDLTCMLCGLPVAQWPPVVPAHWYGERWVIYWPGPTPQSVIRGTRRKAQNEARRVILAFLPNARIKWIDQTKAAR
jgi:hypothetical protein